jgi:hypothetical protein
LIKEKIEEAWKWSRGTPSPDLLSVSLTQFLISSQIYALSGQRDLMNRRLCHPVFTPGDHGYARGLHLGSVKYLYARRRSTASEYPLWFFLWRILPRTPEQFIQLLIRFASIFFISKFF